MNGNIILEEVGGKLWRLVRFFLLVGLSFIILYPLIYMISISFRAMIDFSDPSVVWVTKTFTLENFKDVLRVMDYGNSLMNTLLIGGVSSVLQVLTCVIVAYGFARFRFRGKKIMFGMVILTIVLPSQVTSVPLFAMAREFGIPFIGPWLEQITGLTLSINLMDNPLIFYLQAALGVGIRSGIYIFILRQFFRGFPRELEEAAYIDGCGPFSTFFRIIIPNSTSMMITVFLFSLVWYWNDYFNTNIFISSKRTLSVALTMLRSDLAKVVGLNSTYESASRMQAGCFLVIIPLLILYIFLQRYYTESLERSGIVG